MLHRHPLPFGHSQRYEEDEEYEERRRRTKHKRRKRRKRRKDDNQPRYEGKPRQYYLVWGIIDVSVASLLVAGTTLFALVAKSAKDEPSGRVRFGDDQVDADDVALGFAITAGVLGSLSLIAAWRAEFPGQLKTHCRLHTFRIDHSFAQEPLMVANARAPDPDFIVFRLL